MSLEDAFEKTRSTSSLDHDDNICIEANEFFQHEDKIGFSGEPDADSMIRHELLPKFKKLGIKAYVSNVTYFYDGDVKKLYSLSLIVKDITKSMIFEIFSQYPQPISGGIDMEDQRFSYFNWDY